MAVATYSGKHLEYIHNDIGNAAYYFKEIIEAKIKRDDRDGIALDGMACLLMQAFAFEAQLNFLGEKLIKDWKERTPFNDKVEAVFGHLKIARDETTRPQRAIKVTKEFRDLIAHGKPKEHTFTDVLEGETETLVSQIASGVKISSLWQPFCEPSRVLETYADLEEVWKTLLKASGIPLFETVSQGESVLSFDGPVEG